MVRAAAALAIALLFPLAATAGSHRLGFGYHYWKTLDDIDVSDLDEVDDNGYAGVVSYQYLPGGIARFEFDLEYYKDGFGGSTDTAYSPQAFILFGRVLYVGFGLGATKSDNLPSGDDWSDIWYAGRVGVEFLLLPRIHLDINANYRGNTFELPQDVESDTMTLGAALRFAF